MLFDTPPKPLIGIARLAAESELLEAKKRVEYFEIETRQFLGRSSSQRVPFNWTVNPYRGCEFGCHYCFARYAHEFMELRDPAQFERKIFVKQFDPVAFQSELKKVKPGDLVWMGTATDPYQPAERRFGLARRILEVLARQSGLNFGITTKSDLIARDAAILSRISQRNSVQISMTITTLDVSLARLLEPLAPRPELRLAAVRTLTAANLKVGVLATPVMPLINDSKGALEAVCAAAAQAGACSFEAGPLFLKPCSAQVFFPFLERSFPHLARRYRERYSSHPFLRGHYPEMLRDRVHRIAAAHGLTTRQFRRDPAPRFQEPQLELF